MRIGILGTFVWDTIWHPTAARAGPVEQWGGLAYSMCGFAACTRPGATLVPIAQVGADLAGSVRNFLDTLPARIAYDGLRVVPEANNRVELRYENVAERTEHLSGGVPSWPWEELEAILESVDVAYINLLSGLEMELSCAERIESVGVPVYADLHSLFLGPPGTGARRHRRLPEWERWVRCFDVVQMNENELALLGPERSDPFALLGAVTAVGPAAVFVTRGAAGATYVTRLSDHAPARWLDDRLGRGGGGPTVRRAELRLNTIVPERTGLSGDPTGCGDVWGSVLFDGLTAGLDIESAIRRAHRAAAAKMRTPRIDELTAAIREELGRD